MVRQGHLENAASSLGQSDSHLAALVGTWVVLISCFCFLSKLGGICVPAHFVFITEGFLRAFFLPGGGSWVVVLQNSAGAETVYLLRTSVTFKFLPVDSAACWS